MSQQRLLFQTDFLTWSRGAWARIYHQIYKCSSTVHPHLLNVFNKANVHDQESPFVKLPQGALNAPFEEPNFSPQKKNYYFCKHKNMADERGGEDNINDNMGNQLQLVQGNTWSNVLLWSPRR